MVSLCNLHYRTIYNDMFQPYKCANIRLLVEPKGRLYNKGLGRDEISSYIILWGSGLLILYMISGYYVESRCILYGNCKRRSRPPQTLTIKSSLRCYQQPDDGPLISAKYVVVYCTVM
jgi:hypothetical protein